MSKKNLTILIVSSFLIFCAGCASDEELMDTPIDPVVEAPNDPIVEAPNDPVEFS